MQIHTARHLTVVSVKFNATLNTLTDVVGTTPMQLYTEFETQKIEPAGPMVFVYRGMDGDPDSPFELEVSLPVGQSGESYSGKYTVSKLAPFDYVERTYTGPMDNMGKEGYEPLFVEMAKHGMQPSGEAREVYVHWIAPQSPENRTDIQVGVAR